MKKLICALLLALSSLFAASDEEIILFFKQIPDFANTKVNIVAREKIKDSEFEAVTVELRMNKNNSMQEVVFVNKNLITPELIDIKTLKSYSTEFRQRQKAAQAKAFDEKALALLKNEKMIISIGDKKKPVLYVFSDPQCPYCRQSLASIAEGLKDYYLKYVITSVHGEKGYEVVAMLYKAIKNAKTDKEKIAVLNKYYAKSFKPNEKVSKAEVDAARALFQRYNDIGLRAVPTMVEARK